MTELSVGQVFRRGEIEVQIDCITRPTSKRGQILFHHTDRTNKRGYFLYRPEFESWLAGEVDMDKD